MFYYNNKYTTNKQKCVSFDGSEDVYFPIELDTEFQEAKYPYDNEYKSSRGTITVQLRPIYSEEAFVYEHKDVKRALFSKRIIKKLQHKFVVTDLFRDLVYDAIEIVPRYM